MIQYKDRQFELIIKEGDPKLTVTPTRITVKLPSSVVDIDKYTQWSKLVADQIPLDTPSLRGRFVENSITLRKDNKKVYKTFNFEVVSVREAGYYEPVYETYQAFNDTSASKVITGYRRIIDDL